MDLEYVAAVSFAFRATDDKEADRRFIEAYDAVKRSVPQEHKLAVGGLLASVRGDRLPGATVTAIGDHARKVAADGALKAERGF